MKYFVFKKVGFCVTLRLYLAGDVNIRDVHERFIVVLIVFSNLGNIWKVMIQHAVRVK
jgi:hypothetical protein